MTQDPNLEIFTALPWAKGTTCLEKALRNQATCNGDAECSYMNRNSMSTILEDLLSFEPLNEEEAADKKLMVDAARHVESFGRNWPAHFTTSAWVVNPEHTATLMVFHNVYNSWSWIGGHADGDQNLARVAARELNEETGLEGALLKREGLLSCETLTVDGHWKRGEYVPSHLHLNATYLFEANPNNATRIAPDENSGVKWMTFEEALAASTEPWMVEHVYKKLIQRSHY